MKLYELNEYWNNINELLEDAESEEQKEEFEKVLENINEEIEQKAENIAKVLKNLDANVEALKKEEERLALKRKAIENNIKSLKNYLEVTMINQGKKKFKTNLFSFSIQKNAPSLNIIDGANIPENYYIKQAPKLDKKSLLKDIKNGITVEGVELKQSESLRIR